MKKRLLLAGFALALGAGYTLTAFSQVKPEILVKQRQAAMTLQGKYFGPIAGMAQGKIPYSADVVARNAAYLDVLNKMPWDGFAESTKDVTVKTAALPAMVPWLVAHIEEAQREMGNDWWPYGLEPNRHVLDTFLRYHHEQGLSKQRRKPEDLFARETLESFKV